MLVSFRVHLSHNATFDMSIMHGHLTQESLGAACHLHLQCCARAARARPARRAPGGAGGGDDST